MSACLEVGFLSATWTLMVPVASLGVSCGEGRTGRYVVLGKLSCLGAGEELLSRSPSRTCKCLVCASRGGGGHGDLLSCMESVTQARLWT